MVALPTWARKPELWTWCLAVLGLTLRGYHYGRDPSIWHDEAALLLNAVNKGFGEMFGPLLCHEAAPPLFLATERAISLVGGDSTLIFRLVPFAASCGALILFVPLARRLLPAGAVPWAVLLMACSDRLLWHSCEAKPYAVDVFCATTTAVLFIWTRSWRLGWQFLVFAALAPVWIFMSFPACFVYGGLLLALLPAVWQSKKVAAWFGYALLCLVVAGSFLVLVLGPVHAQESTEMARCWTPQFPNWHHFWAVPAWTVCSTMDVVRYCFEPTGHALSLLALMGMVAWWRDGKRIPLILLVAPGTLGLFAAFFHEYPWGGARVEAYTLPGTALLIAAGFPWLWNWVHVRNRALAVGLSLVLAAPVGWTIYHAVVPWPRSDCSSAAAFVLAHRQSGEGVTAVDWEYMFYFRQLGPDFVPMDTFAGQPEPHPWWAVVDVRGGGMQSFARYFPSQDWKMREEHHCQNTVVCHVWPRSVREPGLVQGSARASFPIIFSNACSVKTEIPSS
jgi:hypothetical protein